MGLHGAVWCRRAWAQHLGCGAGNGRRHKMAGAGEAAMLGSFPRGQHNAALQPSCASFGPGRGRSAFPPAGLQDTARTPGK